MKLNDIIAFFSFITMIVFIPLAFLTKDALNSQLFASIGIISGALITKFMSTAKSKIDEKN